MTWTGAPRAPTGVDEILCSEAVLVNQGIAAARAVTLKCRSWSCEICQPERKKQLIRLARSGAPKTFITLTVNPETGIDRIDRARTLVKAWRLIVKRAKRRHGYAKIGYLCVFEATKAGEPHLHILSTVPWLDQKWLSRQMAELAEAPIVDIRKVKSSGHIAHYIAKYIGKAPHRFGTLKRYWYTKDWKLDDWTPEPTPGYWGRGWDIRETDLVTLQENWELLGWHTIRRRDFLIGGAHVPP